MQSRYSLGVLVIHPSQEGFWGQKMSKRSGNAEHMLTERQGDLLSFVIALCRAWQRFRIIIAFSNLATWKKDRPGA